MRWILLVFLLISCTDNSDDMKMFLNSLNQSGETPIPPPVNKVPIGLTYVATTTTTGGNGGLGGHIQGFVVDEPNDKMYISWSYGVACYKWSDKSYLFRTTEGRYHTGGIGMTEDYVYVCCSSPRETFEYHKDDLSLNKSVDAGTFATYIGAYSYDTNTDKLWAGYGSDTYVDGVLQEVNKTTLLPVNGSTMTWLNKSNPTDFGAGIQSFCFMPNSPDYVAFCNYNKDSQSTAGTNVSFASMLDFDYDLIRNFQIPFDYGIVVIGDKCYIIQKNGGSSNTITDVLEFNIVYQ